MSTKTPSEPLKMTLSTVSTPRSQQFANLKNVNIPRTSDDWILYIVLEASSTTEKAPNWKVPNVRINHIVTYRPAEPAPMDPYKIKHAFADLPADARDTWNAIVDELQDSEQMKGKILVIDNVMVVEDLKAIVKVSWVAKPLI